MKDSSQPKIRNRWLQYRLRTLLVLMLLSSIGLGWLTIEVKQAQERDRAVGRIQDMGGWVLMERLHVGGLLLSVDVSRVELGESTFSDDDAECLAPLTSLQELGVERTRLSDAGLVHLAGLENLCELDVSDTDVTEDGVKKLQQALPNCQIRY